MQHLTLHKMEGAGNDFLILDAMDVSSGVSRDVSRIPSLNKEQIEYLCDRHFGIGADGFVLLLPSSDSDRAWEFYNSDGSSADMCGNASRCVMEYLYRLTNKSSFTLTTKHYRVFGRIEEGGDISVSWLELRHVMSYESSVVKIKGTHDPLLVYRINTGVRHLVVEVKNIRSYPIHTIGRELQSIFASNSSHEPGEKASPNVTFFEVRSPRELLATTFERGVFSETLACGTGALAGALIYHELYRLAFPIQLTFPGGKLTVGLTKDNMVFLSGPSHYIGEVKIASPPLTYKKRSFYGR